MSDKNTLEKKCIDTIRFLATDAIEKAKSGHPGMPLGAAAAAFTLWTKHLKHNPKNPQWPDRDRFVLSSGHASMLLYALLHLTGYNLTLDDIKNFRQWGSITPGHPEYKHTPGVEVTTGPLGQGLANAVGMAIAEAHLAARFNSDSAKLVDHFTYVMTGDGDMMEGVASEACSLAGHLRLGKLIVLYDDNKVTLAGSAALSCTENIELRFKSYGWQVQTVKDGNDVAAINRAIKKAKKDTDRPSLICVQSTIGYGAPCKQGTCDAHGSPLGADELKGAKAALGWPAEPSFFVPEDARKYFRKALTRGKKFENKWQEDLNAFKQKQPAIAAEFQRTLDGELPSDWETALTEFSAGSKDIATRKASEAVMQAIAAKIPEFSGGSADLNPSTFTWLKGMGDFQSPATSAARFARYGWRPVELCRPQHSFRRPGTCHGSDCRRHGTARWDYSLYGHIPALCRLYAPTHASGRADGFADYFHFYSRQHRRGRRRPHTSTDRTDHEFASGSQHDSYPARRRQSH